MFAPALQSAERSAVYPYSSIGQLTVLRKRPGQNQSAARGACVLVRDCGLVKENCVITAAHILDHTADKEEFGPVSHIVLDYAGHQFVLAEPESGANPLTLEDFRVHPSWT